MIKLRQLWLMKVRAELGRSHRSQAAAHMAPPYIIHRISLDHQQQHVASQTQRCHHNHDDGPPKYEDIVDSSYDNQGYSEEPPPGYCLHVQDLANRQEHDGPDQVAGHQQYPPVWQIP